MEEKKQIEDANNNLPKGYNVIPGTTISLSIYDELGKKIQSLPSNFRATMKKVDKLEKIGYTLIKKVKKCSHFLS